MAIKVRKIKSRMKLTKDNHIKLINNFTKKQKKVLDEIKSGERKYLFDINFSKEEYLYKDNNGITFLEHLLKNKIYVDKDNFKDSIEAAYIYCKCDNYIFDFSLTEEDIFSNVNGVRFIDYIVSENKITDDVIKPIKDNVEIIDILISNNKTFYLSYISEDLIEKIMIPNYNGICFIEKYINDETVMENLIPLIYKCSKLIEICKKHNKYDLLKYANPDVLMSRVDKNYTLLEDLLNKKIEPKVLRIIPNNIDFINYLRSKNLYEYLANADEDILLIEINGKTLLEEIIDKVDIKGIKGYISNKKTIQILYKYNKLNIDTKIDESLLIESINDIIPGENQDKILLEYMLNNGYNPLEKSYSITDERIIKFLYSKKEYKILGEKLNEKKLLLQMDDGACLIDVLLDNNIEICYTDFKSEELLIKFYQKNRIDLLTKARLEMLFDYINDEQTYFDCILESIKNNNIKFNLNTVTFYGKTANVVANFYLNIAKNDMMVYIRELEKEDLLKKHQGKTLLDELLDLDTKLTLEKIISDEVKSQMEISIILKSRGLEQKDIDVPLKEKDFTSEYLKNFNNRLGIGPLSYEAETLLKKLSDLFHNDGISDSTLIDVLISGYRNSLFVNYDYYINEIKNLISIKEKNMDKFVYIKDESGAFFRPMDGTVHSDTNVVETLLHETGHALHSYLVDDKMPEYYVETIKRVRENPETLKKVEEIAKKYEEIKEQLLKKSTEKYELFFEVYYNSEREHEIEEFLQKSKSEKKEEYKELGISDNILDIILEKTFTKEEYINHQKRLFIEENAAAMCRSEFGSIMAIGDILDAIYEGKLHSGILKNDNGELIPKTAGHGVSYYYDNPARGFSEMVANFASLGKANDSREMLILLKFIVGKELFDMLNGFYYRNIIIPKEDILEETKTL